MNQRKNILWVEYYKPKTKTDLPLYRADQTNKYETMILESFKPSGNRVIVITGPSGCGKSCLLQTICEIHKINIVEFDPEDEFVINEKIYPKC